MIGAIPQKPRQGLVEIVDFMRKHGLVLDGLIAYGGEDLRTSKRAERAPRVEKCWALMARLSVRYADLETAPPPIPDKPARRRRGEAVFSQAIENRALSGTGTHQHKSNEISDLVNSAPVDDPDSNPESTE